MKKAMKAGSKDSVKKQTQLDMQRALTEDPTIYQYDEVYEDMQRDKCEAENKKKTVRKPRYMENLIKTAERRKIEQEQRVERMVQKEREAEGEQFADKESFITPSYKAKLEELKKVEEEEKRLERLEAIGDVTKQRDMSGFYRHLYRQQVEKTKLGEVEKVEKSEEKVDENLSNMEEVDRDDAITSESAAESDSEDNEKSKRNKLKRQRAYHNRRVYRRRQLESESDTDSSEEEEEEAKETGYEPEESEPEPEEPECKRSRLEDSKIVPVDPQEASERLRAAKEQMDNIIKSIAGEESKPVKVSIWEKRCQGELFEAAVTRYYGRKAERMANNVVY